ncbi:acyltransferase [Psychromonas sp. psych-6C06]|uniref:acyltransferase family protein n=1 Tax=Psychromonas sp. psych-6C06 TaxID=2058089 RepID=UPI000C346C36|nr:acyltransferase family protein [Psychromonas sp. psych-6C06]PKF61437.1 acyltransferase [Psychromonas sp. psych-6C06]
MKFRKDINGLRAIAVIAVVLFHFDATWLPGGFAGVDVFFVISGYLMTGIIFRGIENKNFSIYRFYIARANRIIPPLAVLCLVLLVWGYFYLTPIDYRVLGKHIGGSISFLSNFLYWMEDGYFDVSSYEKWLLHTWSLSVEWQFYIIYPLVLVFMRKLVSLALLKLLVLLSAIIGFIFCIYSTIQWPSSSYYLLSARAWEMVIGGVCYLYPVKWSNVDNLKQKLIEWLGVALIIFSYLAINKETAWPGYWSLIPVLGSCLVILAHRNDSAITSNVAFQKLGAWSYSIYLWHWPIVVGIYFYSLNNLFIYAGILISVLLGFLSNKYIETLKFKNNFTGFKSYFKCKPFYMIISVGVAGSFIFLTNGLDSRVSKENQNLNASARSAMVDWEYPDPNLEIKGYDIRFIKGRANKNILFLGASHIEQTFPYVEQLDTEYNIYYLTQGGCLLLPSYRPNLDCSNVKGYKDILSEIHFDKIVTSLFLLDSYLPENDRLKAAQLNIRIAELNEFLEYTKDNSLDVFLILGEPRGKEFNPKLSIRHSLNSEIPTKKVKESYATHYKVLPSIIRSDRVTIIDPIDYLCRETCRTRDVNNQFYYKDSDHMRPWYAKLSLGYLDKIFDK